MFKLELLEELTHEQLMAMSPEDIESLIHMYNDVIRSMNVVFQTLKETGEIITELFKPFVSEGEE